VYSGAFNLYADHGIARRDQRSRRGFESLGRKQGGFEAGDFDFGEVEVFPGQREGRIPAHALLASDEVALEFDGFLLVGCQCEVVLDGPDGADRAYIAALGAEAEGNLQGLEYSRM